ncbi:MAG: PilZ domain-containing protein [Methylococcaceae bacterium]|nr:PilZ domain-containing protein [Methylococcaceae bacterium]
METTDNQRRHLRLAHRAKVQLGHPVETIIGYTKDISESGLFIYGAFKNTPAIGDELQVLLLDIEDAIPKSVIVRRIDPGKGLAVEFL